MYVWQAEASGRGGELERKEQKEAPEGGVSLPQKEQAEERDP